jgi:hypothetical protein
VANLAVSNSRTYCLRRLRRFFFTVDTPSHRFGSARWSPAVRTATPGSSGQARHKSLVRCRRDETLGHRKSVLRLRDTRFRSALPASHLGDPEKPVVNASAMTARAFDRELQSNGPHVF